MAKQPAAEQQQPKVEPKRVDWKDAAPEVQLDRVRAATLALADSLKNATNVQPVRDILA